MHGAKPAPQDKGRTFKDSNVHNLTKKELV